MVRALMVMVLLVGCGGATVEPTVTPEPTPSPTPSPEPSPDTEQAFRDAMCLALLFSADLPDELTAVADALEAQDQDALQAAYDEMHNTLDAMRIAASDAPIWEPGEEARVSMIRVTNDLDAIVLRMVEAQTWEEAFGETDAIAAVDDRLNDSMARMDALGFDRGGTC